MRYEAKDYPHDNWFNHLAFNFLLSYPKFSFQPIPEESSASKNENSNDHVQCTKASFVGINNSARDTCPKPSRKDIELRRGAVVKDSEESIYGTKRRGAYVGLKAANHMRLMEDSKKSFYFKWSNDCKLHVTKDGVVGRTKFYDIVRIKCFCYIKVPLRSF